MKFIKRGYRFNFNLSKLLSYLILSLLLFACNTPTDKNKSSSQQSGSSATTQIKSPYAGLKYDIVLNEDKSKDPDMFPPAPNFVVGYKLGRLAIRDDLIVERYYYTYNGGGDLILQLISDKPLPSDGKIDGLVGDFTGNLHPDSDSEGTYNLGSKYAGGIAKVKYVLVH